MESGNRSGRKSRVIGAAATFTLLSVFGAEAHAAFSVYDATIPQLETAYLTGQTTTTDVVNQYLARIATYNKAGGGTGQFAGTLGGGGQGINAIAQVDPTVMAQAAAVQTLINNHATVAQYPLLGVPVIVKNSYDVLGDTTTNGTSALAGTSGAIDVDDPNNPTPYLPDNPTSDAFSIAAIRAAGGIIIGKANLSTMAYSFDGIDNAGGVVENPYNPKRTPGGSSSGIGAGIASQFAMLGMGGETGGSIRIPSNANSDVGLKTSAGLIDPSGTYPLTPTRDVVGPIAKTVTDVAYAMNALVKPSATDIFNNTPYYPSTGAQPGAVGTGLGEGSDPTSKGLTTVSGTRPVDYTAFLQKGYLAGKTILVENSEIIPAGTTAADNYGDGTVAAPVLAAFNNALAVMKAQGATIEYADLPATATYFNTINKGTTTGFPYAYPTTTVGGTTASSTYSTYAAAYYYNAEIASENDPQIKNIDDFLKVLKAAYAAGGGSTYSTLKSAVTNIQTLANAYDAGLAAGFTTNTDAQTALAAFASLRQDQIDTFLHDPAAYAAANPSYIAPSTGLTDAPVSAIVAPTYGSVMPYIATALRGGVNYGTDPYAGSTASLMDRVEGNILGLPALSVPDGYTSDGTPMGIQFLGPLDSEANLIGDGYSYEQASLVRVDPDLSFVPEPSSGVVIIGIAGMSLLARKRARTA